MFDGLTLKKTKSNHYFFVIINEWSLYGFSIVVVVVSLNIMDIGITG